MAVGNMIQHVKPGVPRSVHLFVAPFFWTVIGCLLIARGFVWMGTEGGRWLILLSLFLGTFKSLLILDNVARKSSQRIVQFKDGTCLGAIYSWKSWLMVACMMTGGYLLRRFGHPGHWAGMLYCAIGWALCFSSRLGWAQWFTYRNTH